MRSKHNSSIKDLEINIADKYSRGDTLKYETETPPCTGQPSDRTVLDKGLCLTTWMASPYSNPR